MLEVQKHVAAYWRQRPFLNWFWRVAVIGLAMGACWLLLVALGASHFVLVHAFYLPVLLAAFWLGPVAGGVAGVIAGFFAGPFLPEQLAPQGYTFGAWVYRLGFFVGFGVLSGSLIERIYLQSLGVRQLYARTLRGFVRALEYKDVETGEHCERVARNAVMLGRRLGLSQQDREALYWAGYLHDVGKIATPAHILAKPGSLTETEFEVVKQHTVRGYDLLSHVSPAFEGIAEGVRHHHERWDGTGYPDGLAREETSLFGRILGVVDVFEALTSDRPYRRALAEEEAAAMVREGAGTHFDPRIAEVFLASWEAGLLHVEGRDGRYTGMEPPEVFDPARMRRRYGSQGMPEA